MRLLKQLAVVAVVALIGSQAVTAVDDNDGLTLVFGIITAVLAMISYRWVVRRTEHRAPAEAARHGSGAGVLRGLLIGVGVFAAVMLNIGVNDGYRVSGWGSTTGWVGLLGFTAAAVMTEELIFRGIVFRIVEERAGTWGALILTSLLFGLMHLLNPHATAWSALTIAVAGGGMLTSAYAATRTLWVPIGLHFGWNFAEGGIFGFAISGRSPGSGLVDGLTSGSSLLTGGDFGPEASWSALMAGVLVTGAFLLLAHRRGHLLRPRRHLDPAAHASSVATITG
jgi:membrane protease YdiL (CAAX protease family)